MRHIFSLELAMVRETGGPKICGPQDTYRVCADIAGLAQETFHVLLVDAKNKLVKRALVGVGIVDACLVHCREVYRLAVETGASAVIAAHNHPSGEATPSAEDLRITRQLVEAGKILDIKLLDHVVIGRDDPVSGRPAFVSMRESGLVQF